MNLYTQHLYVGVRISGNVETDLLALSAGFPLRRTRGLLWAGQSAHCYCVLSVIRASRKLVNECIARLLRTMYGNVHRGGLCRCAAQNERHLLISARRLEPGLEEQGGGRNRRFRVLEAEEPAAATFRND